MRRAPSAADAPAEAAVTPFCRHHGLLQPTGGPSEPPGEASLVLPAGSSLWPEIEMKGPGAGEMRGV